ncbi:MAG: hypothetical protein ACLQK4_02555 [Acidimicrobiales bacterium]|jgi:hypothetical protein
MTRSLFALLVLATTGLAIALGVGAPDPGVAEKAYAGAAGVLIIVGLLRHLSQTAYTSPTRVRSMSATASGAGKLAGDEDVPGDSAMAIWWTLERALRLSTLTAGHFDLGVRHRLASLARARAGRFGGSASEAEAGALLAPDSLLRPGSPRLRDRNGPGIPLEEIDRIVTILETGR